MAKAQENTVPGYLALERIALTTGIVEKGEKFGSNDVPGRAWKPLDAAAKAAVRARDEAAKAARQPASPDPRIAELEAKVAELEGDNAALSAQVEELTKPAEPPTE